MDPSKSLYTRRQVGLLAGLDGTTLNYWSREGLLVPSEGGSGRGSHRRFDFVQVNIAAILGEMRRFALGITVMRSFADLLQGAARLGAGHKLHPANYDYAARLATAFHRFRSGKAVMIRANSLDEARPAGLKGEAYSQWLTAKRPAASEQEIITEIFGCNLDYDPREAVLAMAEVVGPNRELEAQLYAELVFDIIVPGYSGVYSWLLGFGPNGEWRVEFGFEGGKFFDRLDSQSPEEFGPGIFLPVSGIIRKTWNLKKHNEYANERRAEVLQERLGAAGISAKVTAGQESRDGFNVDAPDADWDAIEAVVQKFGYVINRPEADAKEAE